MTKKRILVAPLDWGLGHASRCVPIINEFLRQGCEVQIASSEDALILLKGEFPGLKFHSIASYGAKYSQSMPFMLKILLQMPKFLKAIATEHVDLEKILAEEKIDLIVSDNRYGCWSRTVRSILITHQVNIVLSSAWNWLEGIVNWGNHRQIRKFSECWVPDFEKGVTGKMSASGKLNVKFIGMVSRFEKINVQLKYDVLALISGPEPQRSQLEDRMRGQLSTSGLKYFIVRGKPDNYGSSASHEIEHLKASELNTLIESSEIIISRSGYTTIMDLWKLGKKAIFIPTPGQTEQEFLAAELTARGIVFSQNQDEFDLSFALEESKKYSGFDGYPQSANLLANAIKDILVQS